MEKVKKDKEQKRWREWERERGRDREKEEGDEAGERDGKERVFLYRLCLLGKLEEICRSNTETKLEQFFVFIKIKIKKFVFKMFILV